MGDVALGLEFLRGPEANLAFLSEEELTAVEAAAVQHGEGLEMSGIGRKWKM